MNDWLSFLLLVFCMIGLFVLFLMNRQTKNKIHKKKTHLLQERMDQVLYFDASSDSLVEEAGEFSLKQLLQFFSSLFSQFRNQERITGKLCDLFRKLNLADSCIEAYRDASYEDKLSMLDDFKWLPVPEITQFLVSIFYTLNSELILIKVGEALAAHKTIDALPIFLIQTVRIPCSYNEAVANVICSFQGDFPGFILDKKNPKLREFETKIEARYFSLLESEQQKIMTAGLYVLGALGLESSIPRILQAIKTPAGRLNLHVACTAMKKFSQDGFLTSLAIWILSSEVWTGDEIQDLISVFDHFYPTGEELIEKLCHHPQLIVQVIAQAALRQNGR
ncbi:hypothetical protein LLG10_05670 [bacterium]|nr:hypothetical protein [bacterium]